MLNMEVKTKMNFRMKILSMAAAVGLVAFCFGCEESGKTVSGSSYGIEPGKINVARLHDKAIKIVKDGLNDNDNLARTQAIEVVSTTSRTELMPYVTNLLRSNSVPVRFSAAIAVGDTQYYGGEFAVKRLLKDSDENVRIAAAYALTKLGRTGLSDNIRNALKNNNQTIRANAALLIGKLGDKNDIDLLYSTIKRAGSSDRVKLQAVESLAILGDKDIYRSKLWPLLISKYADDRVMGIQAMGQLRSKKAKDAIMTMLQDDVPEIRVVAAGELGEFGDKSGAYEVESYLKRNSNSMTDQGKVFAATAIGQIKAPSLTRHLPGLLADISRDVRLTAAASVLLLEK
jgi:HEAT repeat protein